MKKLSAKKTFVFVLSLLMSLTLCIGLSSEFNIENTNALGSENSYSSNFQENTDTSTKEVLSYRSILDYYYNKVKDKYQCDVNCISIDMFIDMYYSQFAPINEFADNITHDIFCNRTDMEIQLQNYDDNFNNEYNLQKEHTILEILSPDEDYIIGANLNIDNTTPSTAFRRAPISEAFDYSNIYNGDIIYEINSSVATKHVALVYNISQLSEYGTYVLTIESVAGGVQYGFLDDERIARFGVSIHRIHRAMELGVVAKVKEFMKNQIGKPYSLDFTHTSTDPNTSAWYCSELIYAAYYNANMEICSNSTMTFNPATMPCIPVFLTQGNSSYQVKFDTTFLDISIESYSGGLWNKHWKIRIYNPNFEDLPVDYNEKMCFAGAARDWSSALSNVKTITVKARTYKVVDIYENVAATSVTVSFVSDNYRYITYGSNLSKNDYSINVGNNKIYVG